MYRFIGIDMGGVLWLWNGPLYYYRDRCYGCPVRPVRTQGIDRTQDPEVAQINEVNEGTQGSEDTQGTQGTKGAQGA